MSMWKPPHRYGIPSQEEIEDTKDTIRVLKVRLADARQALIQAQTAIYLLEQELKENSSWIAPARLLPHDILSMIALEACRQDWKAPFLFGAVCRTWRRSILDTPQAWSCVHWKKIKVMDAIPTILQRGALCPLHIQIREDLNRQLIEKLTRHPNRIQCLTLSYRCRGILLKPLVNLTKLTFTGDAISMDDPLTILDGNMFPSLRYLSIGFFMPTETPPNHVFPPIEELSINTKEPNFSAWVIKQLAHQLTHLHVFYQLVIIVYTPGEVSEIDFPRLRHLTIGDLSMGDKPYWPFNARTPVLESYTELLGHRLSNTHADTTTAKRLFFALKTNLDRFPQLREVTSSPKGIRFLMSCLEAEPEGWPGLETLVYRYDPVLDLRVNAFNRKTGRNIRSEFTDKSIPSRWALTALTSCGVGMECESSRDYRDQ